MNRGTMGVNSLPKTVTRQRRGCDLNPDPSAPECSTLTTRLPSHPCQMVRRLIERCGENVQLLRCHGCRTLRELFPAKRPLVLTRSNFAGTQKYAAHWLGDNQSRWPQMAWSIVGMISQSCYLERAASCGFRGVRRP